MGLKIFTVTAVNKKYKSIIDKNKKKHDKTAFLSKTREVLISEVLNDSYISHGDFILINNVLKE